MEQRLVFARADIEQGLGVARRSAQNPVPGLPLGTQSDTALADRHRAAIAGGEGRMVARGAGDVLIAA